MKQTQALMPWQNDPTWNPSSGEFDRAAQEGGRGYPATTGQSPHGDGLALSQPQQIAKKWGYELPPTPVDLAPSQYVAGLEMPGEGSWGASCGTSATKTACPSIAEGVKVRQLPGAKPHAHAVTPHFCKSPRCAVCWPFWLSRAAMRGDERLRAAEALYLHKEARHFSFSPPQKQTVMRLRKEGVDFLPKLYRDAYSKFKRAGLEGGLVVFHPWRCCGSGKDRYRTSKRQLAPHFHVVGFGYTTKSSEFHANTGWVLKNHAASREARWRKHGRIAASLPVPALLKYLLDHCGLNVKEKRSKDALRAFGTVHQLSVVDKVKVETPIRCASCENQCWVYEIDHSDDMGFGPCIEAAVHVEVCRVYARHKRAKAPPGAPDLYYSIASVQTESQPVNRVQEILDLVKP